jgi:exonuclease SbcD
MVNLLFTGDLHLRGKNPRNRVDDYKEAAKLKLREVFAIAKAKKCAAIIIPGDIWDSYEVAISVLLEFVAVFKESPVKILTTPGNHDLRSYNLSTYNSTSLHLLELLVPQLEVILDPSDVQIFGNTLISFQPFSSEVDKYGYGYDIPDDVLTSYPDHYKIKVTHGYCMKKAPVWGEYTLIDECVTRADLVQNGHDHVGHRVYIRKDGIVFSNPGSLLRAAATTHNMDKVIEVVIHSIDDNKQLTSEMVQITSARPGDEVLDRSRIEAENLRRDAMDSVKMLIQAKTGDKMLIDVDQVIREIAESEGIAPEVVAIALEKIYEQRGTYENK